ncbi:MAG: hypothetical protein ACM359_23770 [Bacillota bacterium]
MSPSVRQQIQQDLDLIERFAQSYQVQFADLIRQLNHEPTPQTGWQCLRLCVEATNMMLGTQKQLVATLREMNKEAHGL